MSLRSSGSPGEARRPLTRSGSPGEARRPLTRSGSPGEARRPLTWPSAAVIALLTAGCASCPCGAKSATASSASEGAPAPASEPGAPAPAGGGTEPGAQAPSPLTEAAVPVASAEPAASLPEVVVERVGMHDGGGGQDESHKAPLKAWTVAPFG